MPLVLVISSYVAASRIGGGIAPYVLGPMKVDPVHIPTCLFGRHPGWGPPGGAAVDAATMAQMIDGAAANGLFSLVDAVVTGHFSHPDQVAVAADAIDRVLAAPRGKAHRTAPARPWIIVDPVMGDEGPGFYVKEAVVNAIVDKLLPRADIIAPNRWEFAQLVGVNLDAPHGIEDIAAAARRSLPGKSWMISSIPTLGGVGVAYVDANQIILDDGPRIDGRVPNGTGDLLTLRFAGGLVSGWGVEGSLIDAVQATHAVIRKTVEWNGTELSLAACSDLLAARHVRDGQIVYSPSA